MRSVAVVLFGLLVVPMGRSAMGADHPIAPALSTVVNLLSATASTFDGGAGGWSATSPASVHVSPDLGHDGASALVVQSPLGGPLLAASAADGSAATPAVPGMRYTGDAWMAATSHNRAVQLSLVFLDASGGTVASVDGGSRTDEVGSWQPAPQVVAVAPDSAAFVSLAFAVQETLTDEAHLIDDASLVASPTGSVDVVGPLTTVGNTVRDGNNDVVTLRGFTRGGFESIATASITAEEVTQAKQWGANFIRLPLAEYWWLSTSCKYDSTYRKKVDRAVSLITNRGMVALLDLHTNMIEPCGKTGQQPMASAGDSVTFWQEVAGRYQDNPLVAFDLYNEPHDISDDMWRNGGELTWKGVTYQVAGMQQLYNTVRDTGAANLVVVTGNVWGNFFPKIAPIDGENIVYAAHAYTCASAPPPTCTNPVPYEAEPMLKRWLTAGKTYPVMVTEFGWPDTADGRYNASVIAYAEAQGWGWAVYTWGHMTWGPFALLATAGKNPTYQPNPGGMPVLAALARNAAAPLVKPGVPVDAAASATAGSAVVSWSMPGPGAGGPVAGYQVLPHPSCFTCSGTTTDGARHTTVSGLLDGTAYTFTVRALNDAGTSLESAPSNTVTPLSGSTYTAVAPRRILDTRATHPVGAGRTLTVAVAGAHGLPANATGVVMNVTATNEQEGGYLTIYPAGSARPTSSNVNFAAHRSTPGLTVARPGANGAVTIFNGSGGSVDVVLDVFGFDAPSTTGATYAPVTPTRRLDTRTTVGGHRSKAVARETLTLATGAPDGATAVGLNVTVTEPTSGGYLTLWAGDGPWPATSNVNFVAKQTVANLVVAPVDDNGAVHIRNGSLGSTHVVADVAGYYLPNASASPYHADTPHRLLDTRAHGGTVPSGGYRDVLIAPSPFSTTGLSAVVLTVTAVKGDGQGYLTAYPSNVTRPTASNVNYVPGVSRANLVMVRLTSTRTVRIFNGGSRPVHVVVDQAGHFTAH